MHAARHILEMADDDSFFFFTVGSDVSEAKNLHAALQLFNDMICQYLTYLSTAESLCTMAEQWVPPQSTGHKSQM